MNELENDPSVRALVEMLQKARDFFTHGVKLDLIVSTPEGMALMHIGDTESPALGALVADLSPVPTEVAAVAEDGSIEVKKVKP